MDSRQISDDNNKISLEVWVRTQQLDTTLQSACALMFVGIF